MISLPYIPRHIVYCLCTTCCSILKQKQKQKHPLSLSLSHTHRYTHKNKRYNQNQRHHAIHTHREAASTDLLERERGCVSSGLIVKMTKKERGSSVSCCNSLTHWTICCGHDVHTWFLSLSFSLSHSLSLVVLGSFNLLGIPLFSLLFLLSQSFRLLAWKRNKERKRWVALQKVLREKDVSTLACFLTATKVRSLSFSFFSFFLIYIFVICVFCVGLFGYVLFWFLSGDLTTWNK